MRHADSLPIGYPFEVHTEGDRAKVGSEVLVLSWFRPPPLIEDPESSWRCRWVGEERADDIGHPVRPTWFTEGAFREAARPGAWALVQAYAVPHYDTTKMHRDYAYNGYGSSSVTALLAGVGLVPGTHHQLARTMDAWDRARAFPRPVMPRVVALGGYFGHRHHPRWLSCRLDQRRAPRFSLVPDAEPRESSVRAYWPWETAFLAVPPTAP